MSVKNSTTVSERRIHLLKKIARALPRRPKLVLLIAGLLIITSIIGAAVTKVNYDILTYLPPDIDS